MVKFTLLSGKIFKVTVDEWLNLEKQLKEMATVIIDDEVSYDSSLTVFWGKWSCC